MRGYSELAREPVSGEKNWPQLGIGASARLRYLLALPKPLRPVWNSLQGYKKPAGRVFHGFELLMWDYARALVFAVVASLRVGESPLQGSSGGIQAARYDLTWAGLAPADRASFPGASPYSITSSARASSIVGMSMPSALAVVRLMMRSNFVGCSTGMSPGFVPRKILSTYSAARRHWRGQFVP